MFEALCCSTICARDLVCQSRSLKRSRCYLTVLNGFICIDFPVDCYCNINFQFWLRSLGKNTLHLQIKKYLNPWWPSWLMHICVTRSQSINCYSVIHSAISVNKHRSQKHIQDIGQALATNCHPAAILIPEVQRLKAPHNLLNGSPTQSGIAKINGVYSNCSSYPSL